MSDVAVTTEVCQMVSLATAFSSILVLLPPVRCSSEASFKPTAPQVLFCTCLSPHLYWLEAELLFLCCGALSFSLLDLAFWCQQFPTAALFSHTFNGRPQNSRCALSGPVMLKYSAVSVGMPRVYFRGKCTEWNKPHWCGWGPHRRRAVRAPALQHYGLWFDFWSFVWSLHVSPSEYGSHSPKVFGIKWATGLVLVLIWVFFQVIPVCVQQFTDRH